MFGVCHTPAVKKCFCWMIKKFCLEYMYRIVIKLCLIHSHSFGKHEIEFFTASLWLHNSIEAQFANLQCEANLQEAHCNPKNNRAVPKAALQFQDG